MYDTGMMPEKRHRALDKREYLMIIFLISHRNYML